MNMLINALSREGRRCLKDSGAQECDEGKEGGAKGMGGFVRWRWWFVRVEVKCGVGLCF